MNNKGQTLILFLLVIPIIVGFLAFFIDISMVNYEKNRLDGIIVNNLEIIVNSDIRDINKIRNVFLENDIVIDNISIDSDAISLYIDFDIKSLFGKILNFDFYELKVDYKGDYLEKVVSKVG